ncbi:hypothetical protein HMPREF1985_01900 [Mitsuokella sp. oral taxon 131 str. W9106]|nr:hypothetical protein HMPREF1985_01900 [Mitsuokella sp. oral taxon 131 str. W9106]
MSPPQVGKKRVFFLLGKGTRKKRHFFPSSFFDQNYPQFSQVRM